jgi:hypothetical protein
MLALKQRFLRAVCFQEHGWVEFGFGGPTLTVFEPPVVMANDDVTGRDQPGWHHALCDLVSQQVREIQINEPHNVVFEFGSGVRMTVPMFQRRHPEDPPDCAVSVAFVYRQSDAHPIWQAVGRSSTLADPSRRT